MHSVSIGPEPAYRRRFPRPLVCRVHARHARYPAAPALPALHKVLEKKGEHEYVRGMAAWAMGQIGPAARSEISLLSETMHSRGHLAVRRASVESLGNLGAAAPKPVVPELVKLLYDDDATTQVRTRRLPCGRSTIIPRRR